MYCKPVKSLPKVRAELAEPIKAMIEAEPSFGYRTVASLLGMNKNTAQRFFQRMGWQVRKRADRMVSMLQTPPGGVVALEGEAGKVGGFSLHAGVATDAHESQKFERLCR